EISQKRKKAAEARWGKKLDVPTIPEKQDTNGMQMHSKSNANGMQGKERKGKESKTNTVQNAELFESWWNLYGNKKGKVKCETKYASLLKKYSHEQMMEGTHLYLNHREGLAKRGEFVP